LAESEIRVEKFVVRGGLRLRFKENRKLKTASDEKSFRALISDFKNAQVQSFRLSQK